MYGKKGIYSITKYEKKKVRPVFTYTYLLLPLTFTLQIVLLIEEPFEATKGLITENVDFAILLRIQGVNSQLYSLCVIYR
jgi:hypothetical protein